jgi:hypothetical protein
MARQSILPIPVLPGKLAGAGSLRSAVFVQKKTTGILTIDNHFGNVKPTKEKERTL